MFTAIACLAGALIVWGAGRANDKDRPNYDRLDDVEAARLLLLHTRQDMKLIAYVLFAILIMLGVIADRLPSHRLIPPALLDDPRPVAQRDLVLRPRFTAAR